MYCIKTKHSFDSAHFLHGYIGKCKNIHGHRWTVEIEVKAEELTQQGEKRGMLVDFGQLKLDLKQLLEEYDHKLIIEEGTLKDTTLKALEEEDFAIITLKFRPTAENLSKFFYGKMKDKGYDVMRCTVYETPNNCAIYEED